MQKPEYPAWRTPEGLSQLRRWKEAGLEDREIAQQIGISRRTIHEWKVRYPEIAEALNTGKPDVRKWLTAEGLATLKGWKEAGLKDQEISRKMGLGKNTLLTWKHRYKEIADVLGFAQPEYPAWLTEDGLRRVNEWAADGLSDCEVAANIGVAKATFCRWRQRYPALEEILAQNRSVRDFIQKNVQFRAALGFEITDTQTVQDSSGTVYTVCKTTHVPGNIQTQMQWLRFRKPDKWMLRK